MYKLLCLLFIGHYEPPIRCDHKDKIIYTGKVIVPRGPIGKQYTLQCIKCGRLTSHRVTV